MAVRNPILATALVPSLLLTGTVAVDFEEFGAVPKLATLALRRAARNESTSDTAAAHGTDIGEADDCTVAGGNCLDSRCCSAAGYSCFEKDGTYANCRVTCATGVHAEDDPKYQTPWSCTLLTRSPRAAAEPVEATVTTEPVEATVTTSSSSSSKTQNHKVLPVTEPIVIKGHFLYGLGSRKRFFAKGIAYSPRNINFNFVADGWKSRGACEAGAPPFRQLGYTDDVATDELEEEWSPNLEAIAALGANTVRLYNINPDKSHTKFMAKAAALGLYVIVPLTRMDWGYLPAFPSPGCYNKDIPGYGNVGVNLLTSAKLIVKQFSNYTNTLMFTVANELPVNDPQGYGAYPCVKALTRDIHQYQQSCAGNMRRIPLIYSDMDMGQPERLQIAEYLTCALDSPDDAVDAYGINVYSWCDTAYLDDKGKPNFRYSPYQAVLDDFAAFDKPLLFTEFGCNVGEFEAPCPYKGGRTWVDVPPMFHEMAQVLSGAVAFEFSMERNQFGIALTPGFLKGQGKLELLDGYYALQHQFLGNDVSTAWDGVDTASCKALPMDVAPLATKHVQSTCPAKSIWTQMQERHRVTPLADWSVLPPTPLAPLKDVQGQSECPACSLPAAVEVAAADALWSDGESGGGSGSSSGGVELGQDRSVDELDVVILVAVAAVVLAVLLLAMLGCRFKSHFGPIGAAAVGSSARVGGTGDPVEGDLVAFLADSECLRMASSASLSK